jgi:hypothetical protein
MTVTAGVQDRNAKNEWLYIYIYIKDNVIQTLTHSSLSAVPK